MDPLRTRPGWSAPAASNLDQVLSELRALRERFESGFSELRERLSKRTKSHLTVDEVAELTGRTPYTIRRWIKEGRLTAQRIKDGCPKGRLLIAREQLDALIHAGVGAEIPDAILA